MASLSDVVTVSGCLSPGPQLMANQSQDRQSLRFLLSFLPTSPVFSSLFTLLPSYILSHRKVPGALLLVSETESETLGYRQLRAAVPGTREAWKACLAGGGLVTSTRPPELRLWLKVLV